MCLRRNTPTVAGHSIFLWKKEIIAADITFNDGAYLGIVKMLRKICENDSDFSWVDEKNSGEKVQKAYAKGAWNVS